MLMNLDRVDHAYTPVTVRFVNDLSKPHSVCWIPSTSSTDAISQHPCKQARSEGSDGCLCIDISAHAHHDIHTTVESVWIISKSGSEAVLGQINVFGGVHIFVLSRYLNSADTGSCTSGLSPTGAVVHVHSPDDCSSQTGYDVLGPMWKDAARIAASRHNFSLCLCGDYNASSTYTLHLPNPELPNILSGSKCACGNGVRNDALPEGHLGVYTLHNDPRKRPLFNMYMPCSFTVLCAQQFQLAMNCHPQRDQLLKFLGLDERESNSTSTAALASRHFSSVRINMLHSTVESDRLSLKNKLWSTLSSFYGHRVASLIMPESFHWEDLTERQRLYELCNSDASNRNVFIMKDPNAHRQHGIQLASAQNILSGKTFVQGRYQMATKFLSDPFLVRGYKINIRRYLLAVCVRGRLRGYVHDDGKNIYTKQRYREPWNLGSSSKVDDWTSDESGIQTKERLEEIITTGYVPPSHFDDKPLSKIEFAQWVQQRYMRHNYTRNDEQHQVSEPLFSSMHARLALAMHASRRDGLFDLCSTHSSSLANRRRSHSRVERALEKVGYGAVEDSSLGETSSNRDDDDGDFFLENSSQFVDPTGELRGYTVPACIESSIRFMHFGCDFHIDSPLTGYESRLFECNKGPDMSAHSYRDGNMKRAVAADVLSFVGFTGKFDGRAEASRRFHLTLVYDSDSFDVDETIMDLAKLREREPIFKKR